MTLEGFRDDGWPEDLVFSPHSVLVRPLGEFWGVFREERLLRLRHTRVQAVEDARAVVAMIKAAPTR